MQRPARRGLRSLVHGSGYRAELLSGSASLFITQVAPPRSTVRLESRFPTAIRATQAPDDVNSPLAVRGLTLFSAIQRCPCQPRISVCLCWRDNGLAKATSDTLDLRENARVPSKSMSVRLAMAIGILAALAVVAAPRDAQAQRIGEDLAGRLTEAQTKAYVQYLRAQAQHAKENEAYWAVVEEMKEARRRKRAAGQAFVASDYVAVQPPKYAGPPLPADVAKIIAAVRPPTPPEPMADLADFLRHAREIYGFVPTPSTEAQFKQRYAEESLALGLTKDQVVRVYALETGGRGTYDMQAGIDPETKRGRPISSALGYAQLLGANSVNELVKHGDAFIARLNALATSANTRRRTQLRAKASVVGRMVRAARSVPNQWSAHVEFSRTPKGLGIHALNLDADIGPWLQTIKLQGVREHAAKAGRPTLSGAEIELMNLAGPQTGLDMMAPAGRNVPTANFFAERAYNRNPIVKDRTSAELLAALDDRMNQNLRKAGSIEFLRIFDAVMAARSRAAGR